MMANPQELRVLDGEASSLASAFAEGSPSVVGNSLTRLDARAILEAVKFDTDQYFLHWLTLPSSVSLIADLSKAVATSTAKGSDADLRAALAKVLQIAHAKQSGAFSTFGASGAVHNGAQPGPIGQAGTKAGASSAPYLALSPRHKSGAAAVAAAGLITAASPTALTASGAIGIKSPPSGPGLGNKSSAAPLSPSTSVGLGGSGPVSSSLPAPALGPFYGHGGAPPMSPGRSARSPPSSPRSFPAVAPGSDEIFPAGANTVLGGSTAPPGSPGGGSHGSPFSSNAATPSSGGLSPVLSSSSASAIASGPGAGGGSPSSHGGGLSSSSSTPAGRSPPHAGSPVSTLGIAGAAVAAAMTMTGGATAMLSPRRMVGSIDAFPVGSSPSPSSSASSSSSSSSLSSAGSSRGGGTASTQQQLASRQSPPGTPRVTSSDAASGHTAVALDLGAAMDEAADATLPTAHKLASGQDGSDQEGLASSVGEGVAMSPSPRLSEEHKSADSPSAPLGSSSTSTSSKTSPVLPVAAVPSIVTSSASSPGAPSLSGSKGEGPPSPSASSSPSPSAAGGPFQRSSPAITSGAGSSGGGTPPLSPAHAPPSSQGLTSQGGGAPSSPGGSPSSRAAFIAAANSEAFPISPGAAAVGSMGGPGSSSASSVSSPGSTSKQAKPGPLSPTAQSPSASPKPSPSPSPSSASSSRGAAAVPTPLSPPSPLRGSEFKEQEDVAAAAAPSADLADSSSSSSSKKDLRQPSPDRPVLQLVGEEEAAEHGDDVERIAAPQTQQPKQQQQSSQPQDRSSGAPAGAQQDQQQKQNAPQLPPALLRLGEGGRGKGRRMQGETLEEKLSLIIDCWTRNNAAQPPPPAPRVQKVKTGPTGNQQYVPVGAPLPTTVKVEVAGVDLTWEQAHTALPVEHFAAVAKQICGFPSFFAAPLMRRIRQQFGGDSGGNNNGAVQVPQALFREVVDENGNVIAPAGARFQTDPNQPATTASTSRTVVIPMALKENPLLRPAEEASETRDTSGFIALPLFLAYWRNEMEPHDNTDRFFRLIKKRSVHSGIEPHDFSPYMEELLAFHPGLAFLEATPEFQEKYARTVIARIFYALDFGGRRVIDSRQIRKSNLLQAFHTVDLEDDINAVTQYFSYEHFYVLYCKFWELDTDHDFQLSRADLSRMSELTSVVLDRVFAGAGRPPCNGSFNTAASSSSCNPQGTISVQGRNRGTMGYEDFIFFFLAEEDKTNEASLRYWFNVCDLDGDGHLTASDMRPFYAELAQRLRNFGHEVIKFEDIYCQMCDLCKPSVDGRVCIKDMLHPDRIKLTGVFFSCMWSVHKLHAFDGRDPILVKQELNSGAISQWDRYAAVEYARLANEEEENNASAAATSNNLGMSDATTASIIGAAGFGSGSGAGGMMGSFGSSTDFGSTFGGPGSSRDLGDDGGLMHHHGQFGSGGAGGLGSDNDDFESILESQRL